MNSNPLVSVVIPAYNAARWIRDALDSVARQTYPTIETLVVDDASTDQTETVVRSHPLPCSYIRNPTNSGPSAARNRAIQASSGKYVAFLDADDVWLPDKLSLQVALLESDPSILAVGCHIPAVESPMILVGQDEKTAEGTPAVTRFSFVEMIVKNRLASPSAVVVRRSDLLEVGLFDNDMCISEDFDLWLRLSRRGLVARIEMPLARYRLNPDGLSQLDRRRTDLLNVQFLRALRGRFALQPGIVGLVRRSLSVRFLEQAIQQCDEFQNYGLAFAKTVQSFLYWPWSDPHGYGRPLIRMRRTRRILIEATKSLITRRQRRCSV